jgi:fucose permease
MGSMFTITVFLQELHHFSAIKTGLIFTAATGGVLVTSLAAERLAKRYQQRTLIRAGFLVTIGAIGLLLLALLKAIFSVWAFVPGLLVFGLGIGAMLTLSRSVSNLGSSLGTAIAGTIVVAQLASSNKNLPYILAMVTLAAIALIGL